MNRSILSFNLLYPHILIRYYPDEPLTAIISNLLQQISYLPDLYGITDLDTVQLYRLKNQLSTEIKNVDNVYLGRQCALIAQAILDYTVLSLTLNGVTIIYKSITAFMVEKITHMQLRAVNECIRTKYGLILLADSEY